MKCKWYNVCPLRWFESQGKLDDKWKNLYCEKDFKECQRYKCEENGIYHPNNLLPDGSINEGLK